MKHPLRAASIFILLCVALCFATPPKSVEVFFDSTGRILTIKVDHDVVAMPNHYIKTIDIKLNKDKIISQTFMSQETPLVQQAMYWVIDADKGDKITITATCSIFGNKSVTIDAPGGTYNRGIR